MTQQEALKELENLTIDYGKRTAEEIERLDEAVDMAMAALRANAVDRQTCEDAVSRQHAIEAVSTMFAPTPTQMDMREDCLEILENLPSAQPQPEEDCDTCKHGYFGDRQCDNCRVRYPSHYEREEEHHGSDGQAENN